MFRRISRRGIIAALSGKTFLAVLAVAVFYISYLWHLGKLTVGLSPAEALARYSSSSWHFVLQDPVNAPHKLLQNIAHAFDQHGALYMRLSSVFFILVFLVCFYALLKVWFGRVVAVLGSSLIVATPLITLSARSATPNIMLLAPLAVIGAYMLSVSSKKYHKTAFTFLVCVGAVSLYIPGAVWFLVIGIFLKRKQLLNKIKTLDILTLIIAGALALAILMPLVLALISNASITRQLLLLPEHWQSPLNTLKSIVWSFLSLIWRTPYHIDLNIGRIAFLNITQIALAAFGIYAMWSRARSITYQLLAIIFGSILFSGINAKLELLIPAVAVACIFAAAGLRYLYLEWHSVFPKNPFPRYLALGLMSLVILMNLILGWHYSLVAWPNTPSTTHTYVIK